jgi:hypothetical protein
VRLELRAAGVDGLVDRCDVLELAAGAHLGLGRAEQAGDAGVREAGLLERAQALGREVREARPRERLLVGDDLVDVAEEPGVDARERGNLVDRHAAPERLADVPQPVGVRHSQALAQLGVAGGAPRLEASAPDLERAHRLLQRLLERPPDGHRLADRLHLRPRTSVACGNFSNVKRGILVTT